MFHDNKENAKYNLQGRILKSFFVILTSFSSFAVFVLSSICCFYMLVINTEFLDYFGVFENQYILGTVCAFTVAQNIVLLLLHIYYKLKKDIYFYDKYDNSVITVKIVCKTLCVYAIKFIKKIMSLIFFSCPFICVSVLIIYLLKLGISHLSLSVYIIGDMFLLLMGVYSYLVFVQKYHLLPFVLFENPDNNIRDIFKISAKKMNGMCKNMLKLKISNLPEKFLCMLIVPMVYYLPYCRAVEADFISQKENPYMRRKAYTEKPIIFYFKEIKYN